MLALAAEADIPLLERVKFSAICSSNLDEFFQVRVAALKDQVAAGIAAPTPDGLTPAQQLAEIGEAVVRAACCARRACCSGELLPEMPKRHRARRLGRARSRSPG